LRAEDRCRRGARSSGRAREGGTSDPRSPRAGRPAPRFPDAGVQPRGQYAGFEIGRCPHHPGRGRPEGADRAAARASAEHRMSGCFFIVAAPSGAGKSSLVNALLAADPDLALSISYTSRPPRPGETDGQHYHFVSRADFERMAAESAFFEHALVHGDWKGTAKDTVSK